jgi:hypothetical protein
MLYISPQTPSFLSQPLKGRLAQWQRTKSLLEQACVGNPGQRLSKLDGHVFDSQVDYYCLFFGLVWDGGRGSAREEYRAFFLSGIE